jgi:predicted ArsR family transcriptional regulator
MRDADDDVLFFLKTRGPQPAAKVAQRLGVTRQAALQRLEKLGDERLVESVNERAGVGRPRRLWSLTATGHARFPDTHAQLTVELLEAMRAEFGVEGVDRLVSRRERSTELGYEKALRGAAELPAKLRRLARAREAEGYMAEVRRESNGAYLLIENHCPICAAAKACQGFCRSELRLFEMLLAPAKVERVEHLIAGGARCAYRITPQASATASSP